MRAIPTQQRSAETVKRIIDAAEKRIDAAESLDFTIKALVDDSGVNEKTIYRYFGSADQIVKEVIRRRQQAATENVFARCAGPGVASVCALAETLVSATVAVFLHKRLISQPLFTRIIREHLFVQRDLVDNHCIALWRIMVERGVLAEHQLDTLRICVYALIDCVRAMAAENVESLRDANVVAALRGQVLGAFKTK